MRILFLEPFMAGSHAAFADSLTSGIDAEWTTLGLPGRHWKWRMRGAAARFALADAEVLRGDFDLLVASSYVPLAELRGLAPQLGAVPAILYFHENQFAYPAQPGGDGGGERDLHFAVTQMTSALAADRCVFNSSYNRDSFLEGCAALLARMPDAVPPGWAETIAGRASVVGLPLDLPDDPAIRESSRDDRREGPVILWNHRWEHDKDPDAFFAAIDALAAADTPFRLIVCGESYRRAPAVFDTARARHGHRIEHWGFASGRDDYLSLLRRSHIAVSTSRHEFFGLAMLEATHLGAHPLVPDRLSYPELFPDDHRYTDDGALHSTLRRLCRGWTDGTIDLRLPRPAITARHTTRAALARFESLFAEVARG